MTEKLVFDDSDLLRIEAPGTESPADDSQHGAGILLQIDRMVSVPSAQSAPPPVAAKRDLAMPLAVVAGCAIAVAVFALLAFRAHDRLVGAMAVNPYEYAAGEGRVLRQYRQDLEQRARQKDAEVLTILRQLEELQKQNASLSTLAEQAVSAREAVIRREIEARLAREQETLESASAAPAETQARLEALRSRLDGESQAELERLRRETAQAVVAQRGRLSAAMAGAREELARLNTGQGRLAPAAVDGTAADDEARDLAVAREVAAGFQSIVDYIARREYAAADAAAARVRRMLAGARVAESPVARARQETDIAVAVALDQYVDELAAAAPATPDPTGGLTVGRVVLVTERTVVIETFADVPVTRGSMLRISRPDPVKGTALVTLARVSEVAGTRVLAITEGTQKPAVMDLVALVP